MDAKEDLKELNLTADEISRFTKAFKDEKFRELFRDFAQEISDPANKKKYEEEITLLEQQRGNNVEFFHPEAFRCLRTSVGGHTKCYVNICTHGRVGKPALGSGESEDGRRGLCWSLPHNVAPGRQDSDSKGNKIMIYDVVFHPDALHMAKSNSRFMEVVDSTAIQAIQDAFKVTLDRNNVREMNTKYKGTPHPYVIREPIPGFKARVPSDQPDPLAFPYPDEKGPQKSPKTSKNSKYVQIQKTKEPTRPNYTVKYRSFIDLQDFRCSRDSARSPRPKAIVVSIDLPLLKSVTDADLEVKERSLLLESREPAYRLELPLAYPVDGDKGEAKFNRQRGQLTVTLPVLPSNEHFEFTVRTGEEEEDEEEEEERDLKQQKDNTCELEEEVKQQQMEVQKSSEVNESGLEEEEKRAEQKIEESEVEGRKEAEKQEELDEGEEFHENLREDRGFQPDESDEHQQIEIKETANGSVDVEPDATSPNHTASEESHMAVAISTPATAHTPTLSGGEEDRCVPEGDEEPGKTPKSKENTLGSENGEEQTDDSILPTEQIQSTEPEKKKLPPVLLNLREIDPDGNETVISDHSTSDGIIFQNSLMYELD